MGWSLYLSSLVRNANAPSDRWSLQSGSVLLCIHMILFCRMEPYQMWQIVVLLLS